VTEPAPSPFNLAQRVAAATAIQVAGKGVALLFALGSLKIATNYLGVGGYGSFAVVLTGAALAFTLADLGLSVLLARELAKAPERTDELARTVLLLRLASCAVVFAVAAAVVPFLPYDGRVRVGLLIAIGGSLAGLVGLVPLPFFQVHLRLGRAAVAEVVVRGTTLVLMAVVAWLDLGFLALVGTTAVGWVAGGVVAFVLLRPFWRAALPRRGTARVGPVLRAAAPVGLVAVLGLLHFKVDVLMLSVLKPAEDVGVYTLAYTVLEQALLLAAVFVGIVFPLLTRMLVGRDPGARQALDLSVRFLGLLAVLLGVLLFALAEPVVRLLSNAEFADSVGVLRILVLALAPLYVGAILANSLVAVSAMRAVATVSVVSIVVNVALNAYAIPAYSYTGAAVTTVASETLALVLLWATAARVVGRQVPPLTAVAKIAVVAAAAAAPLALLDAAPVPEAAASLALGGLAAVVARAVTREDVALLLAARRRPAT
jgi:O-antigen/teichoic acid export membrane protein